MPLAQGLLRSFRAFDYFSPDIDSMSKPIRKSVDLNSDVGENLGPWKIGDDVDLELMGKISSANIATGFHAGDPMVMNRTVEAAKANGVRIGAHPGFPDLIGFGRRHMNIAAEELVKSVVYQIGALRELARLNEAALRHVKLHGALYMHAARDEEFSNSLIDALRIVGPELCVYCMEGTALHRVGLEKNQPMVRELYVDLDYDQSGALVLERNIKRRNPDEIAKRAIRACVEGKLTTIDGSEIEVGFDSICVHGDAPGALQTANVLRQALLANGIEILGFSPAEKSDRKQSLAQQSVLAPIPGTFYRQPAPNAPAYVAEGDFVIADQAIGLIEVMKTMNEITAGIEGRIIRFLVQNAEFVDAGQEIAIIEA
jgi:5-oxoprolinase (ATP-hydrolysing) subunit A